MVEKHLTLDRALPGPDQRASIEPSELQQLVRGIRRVEAALGNAQKSPGADERAMAAIVRRSIVAARNLRAGETLERNDVAMKRPGSGIPPTRLHELLGRRLRVDVRADDLFTTQMFEDRT